MTLLELLSASPSHQPMLRGKYYVLCHFQGDANSLLQLRPQCRQVSGRWYRSCQALPAASTFPIAEGTRGAERDWNWSLLMRTGPFPHLLHLLAQYMSSCVFLRPLCVTH